MRKTEGAAVGQLHDVDGEALVSGLVAEAELHLRAAERRPLLVGALEDVGGDARPGGDTAAVRQSVTSKGSPYLRSDGSYTPLSPATDSSDTAEVTPIFFGSAPFPRCWGVESEDNRGRKS
ncbi:hypothetical protein EYF80_025150 [Liparis tanakae]|uniref:Uncharacterized protein n=1 Tax=Liparis tanakae TaxID=230148 RepID=A0A4Z2HGA9_9TELE|nr:hypothetical protein EYF80_025150 [Liparis tanakae]